MLIWCALGQIKSSFKHFNMTRLTATDRLMLLCALPLGRSVIQKHKHDQTSLAILRVKIFTSVPEKYLCRNVRQFQTLGRKFFRNKNMNVNSSGIKNMNVFLYISNTCSKFYYSKMQPIYCKKQQNYWMEVSLRKIKF